MRGYGWSLILVVFPSLVFAQDVVMDRPLPPFGQPFRALAEPGQCRYLTFSPDGALLASSNHLGQTGLFDVAENIGLPYHPSDFGQTLHSYGVGAGPYVMVPIMGPTTLRDGAGGLVDTVFEPFTYMLNTWPEGLALDASEGLVKREELFVVLDDTKANSVDYYAGIQALYYQDRAVDLRRGAAPDSTAFDDDFAALE